MTLYASLAAVTLPDSGNISRGCVKADFAGRPKARKSATLAWAMPLIAARAGRAPHRALLHGLGHTAPIAIAAFALLYFGGELLRAVLS